MCEAYPDSESERAAVAARGEGMVASSRPCPVCGQPMTGGQTSACSGKCRAIKSRRRRILLPADEDTAIRAKLRSAMEAIWEANATLERYGGG